MNEQDFAVRLAKIGILADSLMNVACASGICSEVELIPETYGSLEDGNRVKVWSVRLTLCQGVR